MSNTVDFGIDLGTTNSCICRMTAKGPVIIQSGSNKKTYPSVVQVTEAGAILAGDDALDGLRVPARRFKTAMGTETMFEMGVREMSPVDLSAEVLKLVKSAVRRRFDAELTHAVITVPAMFAQPQCQATKQAADMAGIEAVALLQEPIAAASAYLRGTNEDGHYLVYDLGGGTFDASIVLLKGGEMHVVHHAGDNHLGGSDFDRLLSSWVIDNCDLEHDLTPRDSFELEQACEKAKIKLSETDVADVFLDRVDAIKQDRIQLPVTVLNQLVSEDVERTIRIVNEQFIESKVSPADIKAVLLVGGTTQMPLVRQRLREALGAPLDMEQDPMTVVAEGASLYAASIVRPTRSQVRGTAASLDLHYEPITRDLVVHVAGKFHSHEPSEVRVSRSKGDWDTGWLPLNDGAFVIEANVTADEMTEFIIEARDGQGRSIEIEPNSFSVLNGNTPAAPVAPYNYGVAKEDGTSEWIVRAGETLPVRKSVSVAIKKAITAGSDDEAFVYFLEGVSNKASDNIKVGETQICGRDISRSLRPNETVTVSVMLDENRLIKAVVMLEKEDKEFVARFESLIRKVPIGDLADMLHEIREDVGRIAGVVAADDEGTVEGFVREIELLEADLSDLNSDNTKEGARINSKLSDLRGRVSKLGSTYFAIATTEGAAEIINASERLARNVDDAMDVQALADMRRELDHAVEINDQHAIEGVKDRAMGIYFKHVMRTKEFWLQQLAWLRSRGSTARDPSDFLNYVRRAESCLQDDDLQGVITNWREAFQLLPEREQRQSRFGDSLF